MSSKTLGGHQRANYLTVPEFFHLNVLCAAVNQALGNYGCYLVGSCLKTRDYRDVDVRFIMPDEQYVRMFANDTQNANLSGSWSLICAALSEWLAKRSGLPIDFQIQKQSEANEQYPSREHLRHHLGLFIGREDAK